MSNSPDAELRARLLRTAAFLEEIAASKDVLDTLSPEERIRLVAAAGDVYCSDPAERRLRVKARARKRRNAKTSADEAVLNQTGIRTLREKAVFTTPNAFAPEDFEQRDVDAPEFRETQALQHCYVCKEKYTAVHHFYDQLCPTCASFNYRKRGELADLSGTTALL
ncbi:MAG: oxidoreductase, partial [Myxococcota bacterium]